MFRQGTRGSWQILISWSVTKTAAVYRCKRQLQDGLRHQRKFLRAKAPFHKCNIGKIILCTKQINPHSLKRDADFVISIIPSVQPPSFRNPSRLQSSLITVIGHNIGSAFDGVFHGRPSPPMNSLWQTPYT